MLSAASATAEQEVVDDAPKPPAKKQKTLAEGEVQAWRLKRRQDSEGGIVESRDSRCSTLFGSTRAPDEHPLGGRKPSLAQKRRHLACPRFGCTTRRFLWGAARFNCVQCSGKRDGQKIWIRDPKQTVGCRACRGLTNVGCQAGHFLADLRRKLQGSGAQRCP